MRDSWLELVDRMLCPARPLLDACLRAAEPHRVAARAASEQRARALSACQGRIEQARAAVFAAGDGIVPAGMTDLEREWRALLRSDSRSRIDGLEGRAWRPGRGSIASAGATAPRVRGSTRAIALAADVAGVEAAEAAVSSLRVALAPWGTSLGAVVRFRPFDSDSDCVTELLSKPLQAALAELALRSARPLERAQQLESTVRAAASARFPDRPLLARGLAHAAYVDHVLRAAALADRPNPVRSLRELWQAGYGLAAVEPAGVTLELPPLLVQSES